MVNKIDPVVDPNQADFGHKFETMTVADVMRWLQVSRATVKVWVKKGLIPAPVRVGKGLRWDKGMMRDWLAAKEAVVTAVADIGELQRKVAERDSTAPSIPVPDNQFRDGTKMVSDSEGDWPV